MDPAPPPASPSRRGLPAGLAVVVTILVIGFVALAGWIGWLAGRTIDTAESVTGEILGEGPYTAVGPVTVQTIRTLAELTTVEAVQFTTVEKGDDRGWLNWATGDRIAMLAVARIGAGVDLEQLDSGDVSTDPATGRAVVTLPAAEVTYVEVDDEATHVYDRDTGVLTQGDPNLERAARLAAREVLVDQALSDGLLDRAERRAERAVTDLLTSLGYTDIQVAAGS